MENPQVMVRDCDSTEICTESIPDKKRTRRASKKKHVKVDKMLLLQNDPHEKYAMQWDGKPSNYMCVSANATCRFYQVTIPPTLSPGDKFIVKGIRRVGVGKHKIEVICEVPPRQLMRQPKCCPLQCGGGDEKIVLVHSLLPYSTKSILENKGFVQQCVRIEKQMFECLLSTVVFAPCLWWVMCGFLCQQMCEKNVESQACPIHHKSDTTCTDMITVKAVKWDRFNGTCDDTEAGDE